MVGERTDEEYVWIVMEEETVVVLGEVVVVVRATLNHQSIEEKQVAFSSSSPFSSGFH